MKSKSGSKSHCDWRSVSQSVSLIVEPDLGLMTRYLLLFESYGLVFAGRPLWRETGLFFIFAAGPCQRSGPYFTVSDLRLPFSSPSTTRKVTVEVFDPSSTRGSLPSDLTKLISRNGSWSSLYNIGTDRTETQLQIATPLLRVTQPLHSNGCFSGSTVLALRKYVTIYIYFHCLCILNANVFTNLRYYVIKTGKCNEVNQ
jgi:hypothetical protein